ncbi:uncharacterized protein TRUGW13939_09094 [Talaromyces rugulosus]|uniref:Uncharacterized protein n=1 Tax=Talaromyces rugulosus TaxID=121627 RepID=A0A7H8R7R5_TALRU|nr:uncharacterized protein TRUGW13939_09094 [Talaromyces rugulosus]QKX61938.1 hypothetical protein TRUGW13939_09094 [Talaromyces rugulosus]
MSNDWEVLEMFHDKKEPIIFNNKIQAYGDLRESMRKFNLAILNNHAESNSIAWIEGINAELLKLQPLFDKIREHNPWSSFLEVFGDAKTLAHVKQRDLKDDWGYDFKKIQEWKELHYGELQRDGLPPLEADFFVEYKRSPYGVWKEKYDDYIYPGPPGNNSFDFAGNGSEDDPRWKDTVSRFRDKKTVCRCHPSSLNQERHRHWLNTDEYM